ncbi:hypothetical protein OB13_16430 [Pontibacter sp. HJ8]
MPLYPFLIWRINSLKGPNLWCFTESKGTLPTAKANLNTPALTNQGRKEKAKNYLQHCIKDLLFRMRLLQVL